mgnify:FL=1
MNNSTNLNDYTLEDLKEILRNACFHPDRIPGQIHLRAEMCEKYALQALWFVREIRFKNFVCSQQSVRELLLREMTVSELDMAEHHVKASPGIGRHRVVAKVLFFYLVFGNDLWGPHYAKEITSDDIVKMLLYFLNHAEFDFGEESFETEVLAYGRKQN